LNLINKKVLLTSEDEIVVSTARIGRFDEVQPCFFDNNGPSIFISDDELRVFAVDELSLDETVERPPSLVCRNNTS
jgi:hypothetical protein